MELSQRDITTSFDDINPGFHYDGNWKEVTGSTRQLGGGVQSTQQTGARMSFTFFGMSFMLYQTVQSGSGTVIVDVSVDGGTPQSVSTSCGDEPVFANLFFTSDTLAEINHTVAVTNRGEPSTPFQFDRADIRGVLAPNLWPPSETVTNALFRSTPVTTVTQAPTSVITTQNTTSSHSRNSSKAVSSSENHILPSSSLMTSAVISMSVTTKPAQTGFPPSASQIITEINSPTATTTQSSSTAAVDTSGRQAKLTQITLIIPLACLMVVVIALLLVILLRQRRSRVNKLREGIMAEKSIPQTPNGETTRPDPFILDSLHPNHISGSTLIGQGKGNGGDTMSADGPPEYRPVSN